MAVQRGAWRGVSCCVPPKLSIAPSTITHTYTFSPLNGFSSFNMIIKSHAIFFPRRQQSAHAAAAAAAARVLLLQYINNVLMRGTGLLPEAVRERLRQRAPVHAVGAGRRPTHPSHRSGRAAPCVHCYNNKCIEEPKTKTKMKMKMKRTNKQWTTYR